MPTKKRPSKKKPAKKKAPAKRKPAARKRAAAKKPARRRARMARTTKPRVKASYRPRLSSMGIGEVRMPRAGGKEFEIQRVK